GVAISSTPARPSDLICTPRLRLSLSAAGGGHSEGARGRVPSDLAGRTGTRCARGGAVFRWIGVWDAKIGKTEVGGSGRKH
ncbi:unnamed protein product, partial [Urochloa humidicola]